MARMVAWAAALALSAAPSAARAAPELLLQAEAQILTGTCTGQPVRLEGNHNTVTLTGECGSLLLKGYANTVRLGIASGGSIHVEGSANRVQFTVRGAAPAIVALGPDNDVSPVANAAEPPVRSMVVPVGPPVAFTSAPGPRAGSPPVPVSALPQVAPARAAPTAVSGLPPPPTPMPSPAAPIRGPLILAGDDQQRLEDCAGRDVTVTGDRSAYVIRGACRSLTLHGDLLSVQAELASGAKITVSGQGSIVSWAVKPKARPPAAIVHGPGSRVQHAETIGGQPDH